MTLLVAYLLLALAAAAILREFLGGAGEDNAAVPND